MKSTKGFLNGKKCVEIVDRIGVLFALTVVAASLTGLCARTNASVTDKIIFLECKRCVKEESPGGGLIHQPNY